MSNYTYEKYTSEHPESNYKRLPLGDYNCCYDNINLDHMNQYEGFTIIGGKITNLPNQYAVSAGTITSKPDTPTQPVFSTKPVVPIQNLFGTKPIIPNQSNIYTPQPTPNQSVTYTTLSTPAISISGQNTMSGQNTIDTTASTADQSIELENNNIMLILYLILAAIFGFIIGYYSNKKQLTTPQSYNPPYDQPIKNI